jgi:hypothetical protein
MMVVTVRLTDAVEADESDSGEGVCVSNISFILRSISTCLFPCASSGEGGGLLETRAQPQK